MLRYLKGNITIENALTIITTTGLSWREYKQWISLLGKTYNPSTQELERPLRLYDQTRKIPGLLPSYRSVRELAQRIICIHFQPRTFNFTTNGKTYTVAEVDLLVVLEFIFLPNFAVLDADLF